MDMNELFDSAEINDEDIVESFHMVANKNDDDLLEWLKGVKDFLVEQSKARSLKQRDHLAAYRGVSTRKWDRDREYRGKRLNKVNKFIINHLYDLTETKVSQINRLKPAVDVLPTNDEWEDKASAKVVGFLIKHLFYINDLDYMFQKLHRQARIFGEAYCFIDWDADAGDLHPIYVAAKDQGIDTIELSDGSLQKIDKPIKTGDICFDMEVPWRVLLQRKQKYEDVEYVFRISLRPVDDLKKDYPKLKNKIDSEDELNTFDLDELMDRPLENHIVVYEFTHIHSKYVEKGSRILFTDEVILERGDHPFSHGQLPMVRLTDLDVPEVLNGVSKYEMVVPIQNMFNNISTLLAKNIYLMAHAKWMAPRGSVKIEHLGNDNTVVQYQGPIAPQMVQTTPNSQESYQFREMLKQEMQTIYGSHGISRGEVPKGITASSALQFLNELENERATTDIAKHGFLILDISKMAVAVAGDKYDITDGRMVRIVGENNKSLIRHFDTANLNKSYDIRLNLSTGLPESKAARMSRVLEAMQRNPQMFSPGRWEELLELGNEEKRITLATEAIKAADSENEDILHGQSNPEPQRWEDHIAHWDSHMRAMQSRSFKDDATVEYREALIDHIKLTEKAMMEKAGNNPAFSAKLATLPLFPIFHHNSAIQPVSAEHAQAIVQGQANKGEDVTGVIPGTEPEIK